MDKLEPAEKHKALIAKIDRAFETRFRKITPAGFAPLMTFPKWRETSPAEWPQLHRYALVRRVFDSLDFLTGASQSARTGILSRLPRSGILMVPLALEIGTGADGSSHRVRDPYEDFLNELSACDLRRLRACPVCKRFFVAWRFDQAACRPRCSNLIRVRRFRQKSNEYAERRKFRRRTGLQAVRHGRNELVELHEVLALTQSQQENLPPVPSLDSGGKNQLPDFAKRIP